MTKYFFWTLLQGAFQKFPICKQYTLQAQHININDMPQHMCIWSVMTTKVNALLPLGWADEQLQCNNFLCSNGVMMLQQPCWWHLQIQISVSAVALPSKEMKNNHKWLRLGNTQSVPTLSIPSPSLQQDLHMTVAMRYCIILEENCGLFQQLSVSNAWHTASYHIWTHKMCANSSCTKWHVMTKHEFLMDEEHKVDHIQSALTVMQSSSMV